mmetsp:Transcript_31748/g.107703  ORF Transcript_31748/g.107703 Transcript_31748/m.107703 type:complete len:206 (-) Transcript_31748:990-1607(-)
MACVLMKSARFVAAPPPSGGSARSAVESCWFSVMTWSVLASLPFCFWMSRMSRRMLSTRVSQDRGGSGAPAARPCVPRTMATSKSTVRSRGPRTASAQASPGQWRTTMPPDSRTGVTLTGVSHVPPPASLWMAEKAGSWPATSPPTAAKPQAPKSSPKSSGGTRFTNVSVDPASRSPVSCSSRDTRRFGSSVQMGRQPQMSRFLR